MEELLLQARPLSALAAFLREEARAAAAACHDGLVSLPEGDADALLRRVRGVALAWPLASQVRLPSIASH